MNVFEAIRMYFKLKKLQEVFMLSGKRTYIVGIGMILYGIGGFAAGIHDWEAGLKLVLEGLGLCGLRAGVAKVANGNGGTK